MKRQNKKAIVLAAFLSCVVSAPWQLEADPIPECGAAEMSMVTAQERSDYVDGYGTTVGRDYESARNQAQTILDGLNAKGLCDGSFFGLHYTTLVCRGQLATLDNYNLRIDSQKEDCGKLLDHLSTPANWEKLASCNDDADSAEKFREKTLYCTGEICEEVHDWVQRSTKDASTPSQAVSMMPSCLETLYRDIYGNTASDAIDIMDAFTVPTYF